MTSETGTGQLIGAIFAGSSDAVIVVDHSGEIVLSSAAVRDLFGYYPEELVGEQIELLVPEELRNLHPTKRKGFAETGGARQMGSGLQLYGQARDGHRFPIDVSLNSVEVKGQHFVAAFVRDASSRVRGARQLEAVNEITRRLLADARTPEILNLVTARARELANAAAAWIVTPDAMTGHLVIEAVDGPGTEVLFKTELSETVSRSAQVMATSEVDFVADLSSASNVPDAVALLGLGPAIYVPLTTDEHRIGVLVLARENGAPEFNNVEVMLAEVFAGAAAVSITLGTERQELERLHVLDEEERIGRDLHDTVIQQAYALGMSLSALQSLTSGVVKDRINVVIDGLDNMIRNIRTSIFAITRSTNADGGLRSQVLNLTAQQATLLGFSPRVAFRGAVDAALSGDVGAALLAVYQEALSNITRHAHATVVEVIITADGGWTSLVVLDDGDGIPQRPSAGSGLANMAARAEKLGGAFSTSDREPRGTHLEWRVPLPTR